ncbi:DUF721 domain-containing protein [Providencia rettgeri]|nr:DUF721 domain-containing protein [Providencia rettgeri]
MLIHSFVTSNMTWKPPFTSAAKKRSSGQSHALGWLANDQQGSQVLEMARQLMAAQTHVNKALPPALGKACKVARIDRQQLTLAVPSAAHAAKLRQLLPTVTRHMNAAGWNISEALVHVQAHLFASVTEKPARQVQVLDERALESFEKLHDSLPQGPLAQAIERLLRHHRG